MFARSRIAAISLGSVGNPWNKHSKQSEFDTSSSGANLARGGTNVSVTLETRFRMTGSLRQKHSWLDWRDSNGAWNNTESRFCALKKILWIATAQFLWLAMQHALRR